MVAGHRVLCVGRVGDGSLQVAGDARGAVRAVQPVLKCQLGAVLADLGVVAVAAVVAAHVLLYLVRGDEAGVA